MKELKLNIGCGPVQPASWCNIDGSNRAKLAKWLPWLDRFLVRLRLLDKTEFGPQVKICNLFKPLPFAENTVDCIYAGEVWEHFEYGDANKLTKECYRVLKPRGVLRVCVPDGVEFWREYLRVFDEEMAKEKLQRDDQKLRQRVGMFFRDICTKPPGMKSMGHFHKWQFDEIQLVKLFERTGFELAGRMEFHKSRISDIEVVERSNFLIVEGIKPS